MQQVKYSNKYLSIKIWLLRMAYALISFNEINRKFVHHCCSNVWGQHDFVLFISKDALNCTKVTVKVFIK